MTTHLTPASPTHLAPSYATPAWLLRGLTNEPGVLSLYAGRLRLVTGEGVVFDVGGRRHRVSLHRPRGSALPPARLMGQDVEPVIGAGRADADRGITVHSVLQGRGAGRVWRALLQG